MGLNSSRQAGRQPEAGGQAGAEMNGRMLAGMVPRLGLGWQAASPRASIPYRDQLHHLCTPLKQTLIL